jgi:hypothetical protein
MPGFGLFRAAAGKQAGPDAGSCAAGDGNRSRLGRFSDVVLWGYGAIRGASFYVTYQMNLPRPLVSIGRGFFEEAVAMRPA